MGGEALQERLRRCMDLQLGGGGRVVLQYDSNLFAVDDAIHPTWLVEHHEDLNTMTLEVPSHGAFSLMHPGVVVWELDREDYRTMEGGA